MNYKRAILFRLGMAIFWSLMLGANFTPDNPSIIVCGVFLIWNIIEIKGYLNYLDQPAD